MKCIDAEKLYKKVDELMAHYAKSEEDMDEEGNTDWATYYQGKRTTCSEVLDIITFLQQEPQSEYVRKDMVVDAIRLAYGKVSMNPFDCSDAFEELLNKVGA